HPGTPCPPAPAVVTALPGPQVPAAAARQPPAATSGPDADGPSRSARSRGSAPVPEWIPAWPWKPGPQPVRLLALPPSRCPRVAASLAAFASPAPSSRPQAPPRPLWSPAGEISVIPAAPSPRNFVTYRNGTPLNRHTGDKPTV